MKSVVSKIKPKSGFSHFFHILLVLILPTLVFVFVRIELPLFAAALIFLSKWRMFAVRPRYWPANIRANSVDLIVGFSILIFMTNTEVLMWQFIWAVVYGVWLVFIKPGVSLIKISVQSAIGQLFGLMALFLASGSDSEGFFVSTTVLTIFAWAICYLSARHFFSAFDEKYSSFLAHLWGYFAAALTWLLSHWLLFYGSIAQVTILLSVIGFSLGSLYYLDYHDKLSDLMRKQFVFMMVAIVIVVLVFSDWGDKTI